MEDGLETEDSSADDIENLTILIEYVYRSNETTLNRKTRSYLKMCDHSHSDPTDVFPMMQNTSHWPLGSPTATEGPPDTAKNFSPGSDSHSVTTVNPLRRYETPSDESKSLSDAPQLVPTHL
jgi:hypothetical protein